MEQQIENMDLAPNMLTVSLGRQRTQAKNLKKLQIKGKTVIHKRITIGFREDNMN